MKKKNIKKPTKKDLEYLFIGDLGFHDIACVKDGKIYLRTYLGDDNSPCIVTVSKEVYFNALKSLLDQKERYCQGDSWAGSSSMICAEGLTVGNSCQLNVFDNIDEDDTLVNTWIINAKKLYCEVEHG